MEAIPRGSGEAGDSVEGKNFLQKDEVRLRLSQDGEEAGKIRPLVEVEAEDG